MQAHLANRESTRLKALAFILVLREGVPKITIEYGIMIIPWQRGVAGSTVSTVGYIELVSASVNVFQPFSMSSKPFKFYNENFNLEKLRKKKKKIWQ